jgi:hypothetical protein
MAYPDRTMGVRAPLSAACDANDAIRCALPWPSSVFTVPDATSATGLRVAVDAQAHVRGDRATTLNRSDGFSRVTPVVTAFAATLDPASLGASIDGALRLYAVREGALTPVPLRYRVINGSAMTPESLVIGYPRVPLAPATDHVVVVLDALRDTNGTAMRASQLTRASLGLSAPTTDDESRRRAYHAPTRALLMRAGVDLTRVVRVWDFTTRSRNQPTADLREMRRQLFAALDAEEVGVRIDMVRPRATGPALVEVFGHLTNVPRFVDEEGRLVRDADGTITVAAGARGRHEVPFRALLPRGTGPYRVAMWGHGTGGDVDDTSFDNEITGAGAAKINLRFEGWSGEQVLTTFASFQHMLDGVDRSTAGLLQSVADGQMVFRAVVGHNDDASQSVLGSVLAAPMLGTQPNPAAGRLPRADGAIWTGGSLGGTMGLVYTRSEPRMRAAVLNVPGAAWTHYLTGSSLYPAARLALLNTYGNDIDIHIGVVMSQAGFDPIDGSNYDGIEAERPILVQQSMGDPVLPNPGSEMVAAALGALHVGAVLAPVPGVMSATEAVGRSALTQYRVPSSVRGPLDVHGFAARDTPAGRAAREQIQSFITSLWAGRATITLPAACRGNTPMGSCDFSMSP